MSRKMSTVYQVGIWWMDQNIDGQTTIVGLADCSVMNTMTSFPFDITGKHSLFHNNIPKWLPFICCIFVNRGELQITNLSLLWHHGMEMTSTLLALCDRMNWYMVHSLKKSQWCGALLFLWMLAWTKKQWSGRWSEPPWCPEDIFVMQQVLTFSALLALCARN